MVILGKYRVERVIGVGGMGAVVAARHLQLEEAVAIKFLHPATLDQPETVQRFLREARSAIKIRSEHCVRVLDVGTLDSGAPYMVMEYLEGYDLARLLEQSGSLPIADAVDWVLQAAEALAEAHAMGIVHRDLKPANLFLTRRADGSASVKVLDFGISKQTAGGAEASVTRTQAVLGSPRYMSPEQMRSTRDVDARADVWALGAVAHELIAGQPPFDAETMTALCAAILQDPPNPLRVRRPDAPVELEAAILGALEKDRARRYPNVAALAAAIAPFGTPAAALSAERIARVLGISGMVRVSRAVVSNTSFAAGVTGDSPTVATTGGAVTDATNRGPVARTFLVLVLALGAALAALLAVGVFGVASSRRRVSPTGDDVQGQPGTAHAQLGASTPVPAAQALPPLPSAALAEPAPVPRAPLEPSGSASTVAVPDCSRPVRATPPPPRQPAAGPGRLPRALPPGSAQPSAPKPSAAPSNPFGDD